MLQEITCTLPGFCLGVPSSHPSLLHPLQALGRLYQRPSLAGSPHMTANAGELFDVVVAPYFPMLFTPPKDDPVGLTREQLLQGVVQAMASTPVFAPLAIPYISEKLGSDFK